MILGITGGTGCGKTTLLHCIEERGGLVLDCDAIYHRLVKEDRQMLTSIAARFPEAMEGESLVLKKLGKLVFADEKALLDLNAITHQAVKAEVLGELKRKQPELAAIDAIALFEGGLAELCDRTVAVIAPVEARIRRLMLRDQISESYARSRIAAQHEEGWFRDRVDFVLTNDGTAQEFQRKCGAFLDTLGIRSK